jgi:hypothetical protein
MQSIALNLCNRLQTKMIDNTKGEKAYGNPGNACRENASGRGAGGAILDH